MSAIKNPADKGLESVAMIFPPKFIILNDFIVFMPAGPEAPGIRTAGDKEEVLLFSLDEEDRIIVVDEDDEDDDMALGKGHDHYFIALLNIIPYKD
jgi:hypothetical protein